jgi:hypothetical protein
LPALGFDEFHVFLIHWRLWSTFLTLSFQVGFDLNEPPIITVGFNVREVVFYGGVREVCNAFVEKFVWVELPF